MDMNHSRKKGITVSNADQLKGISEFWRRNTSTLEAVELACLLNALRKVAGHLGLNVGRIEYAGMSDADASTIIIDPAGILGKYPVPPEKVDELVGIVTHEALHQRAWSEHVWKLLEQDCARLEGRARIIFQKIVHTGEDIFVDMLANRTVLGLYVEKVRWKGIAEGNARFEKGTPSVDALLHQWWAITWGEESESLYDSSQNPLAALVRLTEKLHQLSLSEKGVIWQCEQRAVLYRSIWNELKEILSSMEIIDKRLLWSPEYRIREEGQTPSSQVQENQTLTHSLIRTIEHQLAATSCDITPLIRHIVGHESDDIVPTSRWDYNIPAHPVIDRHLVTRLRGIFRRYAEHRRMVSRGLMSGSLDSRRLHRAALRGNCFKQTERLPSLRWNITFLMDASGSMRGRKWRMVENTVANIHRALTVQQNLQAFAYFEINGVCMISRLIRGKQLLSVPPTGQTASGQALIAAALLMPKDHRRKLLIHVTDGESNIGCNVQCGIDFCKRENIHLITLGCGCRDRAAMVEQYGRTIQFVEHFGQLPDAIERLLKWTFQYGAPRQPAANVLP